MRGSSLAWILCAAALAQAPSTEELAKQIAAMRAQSISESNSFRENGGIAGAPDDPAVKWANSFWRFREQHTGTPAGTQATGLALAWFRHSNQDGTVLDKADQIPLDDPAWASAIGNYRDSSRKLGSYDRFFRKVDNLLKTAKSKPVRAAVHMQAGLTLTDQNQLERAKAAFQGVIDESPGTPAAEQARVHLLELTQLSIGQPAPHFTARTIDGKHISSESLRGKVVLLNFWATW